MTELWFFKHCNVYGTAGLQCIQSVFLKMDEVRRARAPLKRKIFKSRFLWGGDIIKMTRRFFNIVYLRSRTELKTWNSNPTFFSLLLVFSRILLSPNSHGIAKIILCMHIFIVQLSLKRLVLFCLKMATPSVVQI